MSKLPSKSERTRRTAEAERLFRRDVTKYYPGAILAESGIEVTLGGWIYTPLLSAAATGEIGTTKENGQIVGSRLKVDEDSDKLTGWENFDLRICARRSAQQSNGASCDDALRREIAILQDKCARWKSVSLEAVACLETLADVRQKEAKRLLETARQIREVIADA